MPVNMIVSHTFFESMIKFSEKDKKATISTIKQLNLNAKSSSLSLHDLGLTRCDKTFKTARVNSDLRIVLSDLGSKFILLYVAHHDDAYKWCQGKFFGKTNFGAKYLYDETVFLNENTEVNSNKSDFFEDYLKTTPIFDDIKEKHLIKLGLPEIHVKYLSKITSQDDLLDYIKVLPEEIQEALLDLASNSKTIEQVLNELEDSGQEVENGETNFEHKDSKRRFYTPKSIEELEILIENDEFEKWSIFLHPSQKQLVEKNFSGPALVEGGPGTGKTIVGIHRAVYLAENVYTAENGGKILFCTYSKKLAKLISQKLNILMKNKNVKNNVEVVGVDSLIYEVLRQKGVKLSNYNNEDLKKLIDNIYVKLSPDEPKSFYEYEYTEVIERYNIKTLEEYLKVDRSGTGIPLNKNARTRVWMFFEMLIESKRVANIVTFVDRAHLLNDIVLEDKYDSIIIDEAQDLESVKLHTLCNLVKNQANNIMILSDINQRIFNLSSWKKDVGINIVGRTQYLSINYRTTKQINDYAMCQFVESEIYLDHIKEYKSIMTGLDPEIIGFSAENEQLKFIVSKVKSLLDFGYRPYQIGIICGTTLESRSVKAVLEISDIKTTMITGEVYPTEDSNVCICTSMGVKGLEFEVVLIYNYTNIGKAKVDENALPGIRVNYRKLVECEKYVATTRARNELIITYMEDEEE